MAGGAGKQMNLRRQSVVERKFSWTIGACFTLLCSMNVSSTSVAAANQVKTEDPHALPKHQFQFATTLKEQETQLHLNPQIRHFAKVRQRMADDPYRPTYHFISPDGNSNDPNGLSFWRGRWHLFYQAYFPNKDSILGPVHWGHAVSDDLIRWRDLPYAIYPGPEAMAFSGSTVVERDRVVAFYPGIGARGPDANGQMVAISSDPLLLNWKKIGPVNASAGDSDIWKEGDTYFGLVGGIDKYYPASGVPVPAQGGFGQWYGVGAWPTFTLWESKDLLSWKLRGPLLLENTPYTDRFDDGSCPNFLKIADKYILLWFSHINGAQYLLGDYDAKTNKFRPYDHGRFNHGQVMPGGIHAPSGSEDGAGGVIGIFDFNEGRPLILKDGSTAWDRPMSLPQRLTLGEDKRIRISPIEAIATLRGEYRQVGKTVIPTTRELILPEIQGNAVELNVEIEPKEAQWVRLNVLRSANAEEHTSITFYNLQDPRGEERTNEEVVLDSSRSSTRLDIRPRSPEKAAIKRDGENLKLKIFVDRSVVEVFVNERQYLAARVYPHRKDSLGVSLRAHGQEAVLEKLDAWQMKAIWPVAGN